MYRGRVHGSDILVIKIILVLVLVSFQSNHFYFRWLKSSCWSVKKWENNKSFSYKDHFSFLVLVSFC